MSWLFSRALEEEYSEANSSDGEPSAQLNVMPTQRKFWRNDKMIDHSKLSLFGLTLKLLTEGRGEELLTSFLAGFPARISAQPEKVQELPGKDLGFGSKWRASFAKYDPATHSLKTAQCSLLEDSTESCATLPKWGSMRNGVCLEQTIAELNTLEKEFGYSLPTPTATTYGRNKSPSKNSTARPSLNQMAKKNIWPTPVSSMSKGSSKNSLIRKSGKSRENDRLDHAVMASEPGQLNPTWVEWLMGWPLEWTDLKPLETAKFQEWQQQHSSCYEQELKAVNF